MMLASNNGVGMSVGFPDPKMTPPMGAPIPYPNLAMNCMSAVFSPNIFVGYMPQLTMASIKPMTLGNSAGVMHPLFMMMGGQTAGNPRMLINCMPAMHLGVPTWGNCFNNPVGMVAVPSVTTTFYSDAEMLAAAPRGSVLSAEAIRDLERAVHGSGEVVTARELVDGIALLDIRRFTRDAPTRVYNAMRGVDASAGFIVDLRGNPGGDCRAALELADEMLPEDAVVAIVDGVERRGRLSPSYATPLVVVVDERTASAAEILAAALQHHGATIVGKRTVGKGTAQSVRKSPNGSFAYQTVATYAGPGGPIDGCGVSPDHVANAADAMAVALGLATK